MKAGAENRKKTITLGVLIAVAVCGILYNLFTLFGPSTPPPSVAPVAVTPTTSVRSGSSTSAGASSTTPRPNRDGANAAVPGVAAQRLASSANSLDPTLDQASMLRTESLVYSGSGRNIFSAIYTPPAPVLPTHVPPARPGPVAPPPPPLPTGPPPPPAIPLKFFGTAQRSHGPKQVFLLSGEDVYLASAGDIVARRFKVDQILPNAVQITDMVNNNTQTLPLIQQ